ncbi:MAG: septum formation inhibitor Maf [Clostridia bacterium]|nr:septum formation inhibitor Maf [Clostridia bacterium]
MFTDDFQLVLASASPRRRELLAMTGIPFIIDAPEVDERCDLGARDAVAELARRKAEAGRALHPDKTVLASDTLVAIDDQPLGKPADEADAFRMLRQLSGRWHHVYTGVCIIDADGHMHADVDATAVHFCPMTDEEIRAYIATGEPMDKAGSYALQGIAGLWVDMIEGSSSNVIGLPLSLTRRLLAEAGLPVLGL